MTESPQRKAVRNYRRRLTERGLVRFEVVAPECDRELIRSIASRLSEGGPEAARIREAFKKDMSRKQAGKGNLWRMLRRSPLVGADLDLSRPFDAGREIDL